MATPRRVALLLVVLVLGTVAVGPGAGAVAVPADHDRPVVEASQPATLDTAATAATSGTVAIESRLFLTPDRQGSIRVETRVEIPDNVGELSLTLLEDATVTGTDGFDSPTDGSVEWDGETRPAAVTYTLPANRTGQLQGPEGAAGEFLFADVGEWALVEAPDVGVRYRFTGDVTVSKTVSVDGEGVVGNAIAYLGPGTATSREAHGQTIHLVVPDAARLEASREAVLDAVAGASDALRVGERDPEIFMFAAPTSVDWGVEGLQVGDTDLYVTADEPLDEASNTWLHEYVHTRQNVSLAADVEWISEASATYYAALLTLEQERIGFEDFRDALAVGARDRYDDVVLAERATWAGGGEYFKGALVAGELDRRLRLATDSGATLQAVVSEMNGDPAFEAADMLAALDRRGGSEVRRAGDRFTTTTDGPDPWSPEQHHDAFGQLPARVEVTLPARTDTAAWQVAGPYRNGSVSPTAGRFVPGESLQVRIPITNAGGTSGTYDFAVRLDGRTLAQRSGTVDPDTTGHEDVSVPLESPGDRTLQVAGDTVELRVREPAALSTRSLEVNRSTVSTGAAIRVTVGVANAADLPGESTVSIAADGEGLDSRTVRLGPDATRSLSLVVRFDAPGERTLTAGNRSARVSVEADDGDGADGGTGSNGDGGGNRTTAADGPGFGPTVALLAVLFLVVIGLGRSYRK